ncbi:hypothetical protein D3C81_1215580 [compost metagenome]
MLACFSSLSRRRMRSDVVPALVTTALPERSPKSRTGLPFFTSSRVPATKNVVENATCCWRDFRLVVTPHSRSTVPFCTSEIRFCEVTGTMRTCSAGTPVSRFTASITRSQMSCEKPITFWLAS